MPLPTCQQYRALKGFDLALHVLLDDAHEARAAELVPTRVQRTRVRSAQRSSRPPEHERHERARAPQRGTLQRASGYLRREDLERGCPGRRLRNALGTHVDQRERGRTEDRCSRRCHRSEHGGCTLRRPRRSVPESATEEGGSQPKVEMIRSGDQGRPGRAVVVRAWPGHRVIDVVYLFVVSEFICRTGDYVSK